MLIVPLFAMAACADGALAPALLSVSESPATSPTDDAETEAPKPVPTAGLQKFTYQSDPIDLPAGTEPEEVRTINFNVDEPMWVKSVEMKAISSNGQDLPDSLIHFAVLSNKGEDNPLCNSERTGNPFAASTTTVTKNEIPEGYGYPVMSEDPLVAQFVLHNPSNEDFMGVKFTFTIEGSAMDSGKAAQDVYPLLLDTDPCKHLPLAVEPGEYIKRSERFAIPEGGKIVAAYGLLQPRAVNITLGREGEADPFWQASATINKDQVSFPPYADPDGIDVAAGDGLELTVAYHNFSEEWDNSATAAAIIYLAPSEDLSASGSAYKPYKAKSAASSTSVQSLLLK